MDILVVRAKELAKLLSISIVSIRRMDSGGLLPKPLRLGGCVVWNLAEIKTWLSAGSPNREKWQAIVAASKKGVR